MPEVNKQFELRQLLKAYRKGLISDELFEEQMREIQTDGANGRAEAPAKIYRVRDRTFASEREMLICFLDEFRAGESFGGVVLSLWIDASQSPVVRGGLRAVCEREAMHGRLLANRLSEIGGSPQASLPEKFREAARARLGARDVSDADKIADFIRRLPDENTAVAPIREVIAQIEQDRETRTMLEVMMEDERATVRWFHAMGKALGVNGAGKPAATPRPPTS